jgi:hypothetical protein
MESQCGRKRAVVGLENGQRGETQIGLCGEQSSLVLYGMANKTFMQFKIKHGSLQV